MAENKRTTVIRLMQLDNNPSLLTSMDMPMVPFTGGFLFRQRDTFKRLYTTRARKYEQIQKRIRKI